MTGLDLVMVFAIILFARLGVRLVTRYISMKKGNGKKVGMENGDEDENENENENRNEDKENER